MQIPEWAKDELALRHQLLLTDIQQIAAASESMQELGQRLTAAVRYALNVDACVARLLEGDRLRLFGETGLPPSTTAEWMSANVGIAQRILTERQIVTIGNVAADSTTARLHSMSKDDPKKFQFMSYAGAPMIYKNETVGVLGLFTVKQSRFFSTQDLGQLQAISNRVAAAVREFKADEK